MAMTIDPKGLETQAIHDLVDFRGKEVLEIGCGDGRVTWRYAADTASVVAIDPDGAAVEVAQKALPESLRSTVSLRVADVTTVDVPEGGFDIALFSGSL